MAYARWARDIVSALPEERGCLGDNNSKREKVESDMAS